MIKLILYKTAVFLFIFLGLSNCGQDNYGWMNVGETRSFVFSNGNEDHEYKVFFEEKNENIISLKFENISGERLAIGADQYNINNVVVNGENVDVVRSTALTITKWFYRISFINDCADVEIEYFSESADFLLIAFEKGWATGIDESGGFDLFYIHNK